MEAEFVLIAGIMMSCGLVVGLVLGAAGTVIWSTGRSNGTRPAVPPPSVNARSDAASSLKEAISRAIEINPDTVDGVPIGRVQRHRAIDYRSTAAEAATVIQQGRSMSIDLSGLAATDAVQVVDFCSGAIAASSGSFFCMADRVIIISPKHH